MSDIEKARFDELRSNYNILSQKYLSLLRENKKKDKTLSKQENEIVELHRSNASLLKENQFLQSSLQDLEFFGIVQFMKG